MIRYICPVCGHSGAHGVDMKAPLCDKCNYKVTMVAADVHTKLAKELGVSRAIAKEINFGYLYGKKYTSDMNKEALKDFGAGLQNKVDRTIFTNVNAEKLK